MNEKRLNNWLLCSSESIKESGQNISKKDFAPINWHPTKVPSTVLGSLVENDICRDPYFGKNLSEIKKEQFTCPWWYRTSFPISSSQLNEIITISFKGINYKANIWLNGNQLADTEIVYGAFRQFEFDISNKIIEGDNILAVEVITPKPGDFSIGFVDWNPSPPDNNLGIFRDVTLQFNGGVSLRNPFVETKIDTDNLNEAELTLSVEIQNHSLESISGLLTARIEEINIKKAVSLEGKSIKEIVLNCNDHPELIINNPRLWWPNNLGNPELYTLNLSFDVEKKTSDSADVTFGIRKVEDYINDGGHKGFKINGHKVLIKGAGWTDDLFLQDTYDSLRSQIEFVKDMNLNCIRLEGIWGKDKKLYDLCDENGILMMVGWSCHWEHEQYLGKPIDPRYGGIIEKDEIKLIAESWKDQVIWLRNHPSIFVWTVGSDMVPHPDLERKYIDIFSKFDSTRPYLNSTGGVGSEQGIITSTEIISEISGSSRVKMLGPYAYTPPIYWFTNENLGGAYGFNTETCPGANVPPIESLKEFIPEDHLWPIDEYWDFHCGKNEFATLDRFKLAVEKRYGTPQNLEDFSIKAQMMNYELMRPMFEAFQANRKNATGIIQWMLNSAWPEMYWQLYDTSLRPNGAYYGAKKANEPLHLLYNYGDNSIYKINDTFVNIDDYKSVVQLFDVHSNQVFRKDMELSIPAESSSLLLTLPRIDELTKTYFLSLKILDKDGLEISSNFYWLSTKEDALDYEYKFEEWAFYTPSKEYADFSLISEMPKVKLKVNTNFETGKNSRKVIVNLENDSELISFFNELLLFDENGKNISPVIWNDNYVSLLPGETRIIEGRFDANLDHNDLPELRIRGWNLLE